MDKEKYTNTHFRSSSYLTDGCIAIIGGVSIGFYKYFSVCLFACPSVCPSVRLTVCPSIPPSICLSTCPSVPLSVCRSVRLTIRLSICLLVCLSEPLSYCLVVCQPVCLSCESIECKILHIAFTWPANCIRMRKSQPQANL